MEEQTLMWMRLGNAGLRFDAAKVAAASRTRAGRARVLACLSRTLRAPVRLLNSRAPKAARSSRSRVAARQRASGLARAAVARPQPRHAKAGA